MSFRFFNSFLNSNHFIVLSTLITSSIITCAYSNIVLQFTHKQNIMTYESIFIDDDYGIYNLFDQISNK
jgi:hypothetical protein